jgi:hypothetical protein
MAGLGIDRVPSYLMLGLSCDVCLRDRNIGARTIRTLTVKVIGGVLDLVVLSVVRRYDFCVAAWSIASR